MSSYTSQPHTYTPQPHYPQSHAETTLVPRPQHRSPSSSYNTSPQHHLTPYDAYAAQSAAPHPARRPSSQSHHSHRSARSQRSHRSHHSQREEREMEKRPSLGDTVVLVWDAILGAFSRRRV